jgi:hypothetical protein
MFVSVYVFCWVKLVVHNEHRRAVEFGRETWFSPDGITLYREFSRIHAPGEPVETGAYTPGYRVDRRDHTRFQESGISRGQPASVGCRNRGQSSRIGLMKSGRMQPYEL